MKVGVEGCFSLLRVGTSPHFSSLSAWRGIDDETRCGTPDEWVRRRRLGWDGPPIR